MTDKAKVLQWEYEMMRAGWQKIRSYNLAGEPSACWLHYRGRCTLDEESPKQKAVLESHQAAGTTPPPF